MPKDTIVWHVPAVESSLLAIAAMHKINDKRGINMPVVVPGAVFLGATDAGAVFRDKNAGPETTGSFSC